MKEIRAEFRRGEGELVIVCEDLSSAMNEERGLFVPPRTERFRRRSG